MRKAIRNRSSNRNIRNSDQYLIINKWILSRWMNGKRIDSIKTWFKKK